MASSKTSLHSKPPRGRPTSTSATSQPSLSESLPVLSSFSPDGNLFALIKLAVDKHRLRVYNTISGHAIAEHTIQTERVSTMSWSTLTSDLESIGQDSNSPSKKRKKKRSEHIAGEHEGEQNLLTEVVVLGLSNGAIVFFSPSHSKIIRTLTDATSISAILSLTAGSSDRSLLWSSNADGSVHLWNAQKNLILRSWKNDDRIPYTSLAVQPTTEDNRTDLLAAHHHIRLLADVSVTHDPTSSKPKQLAAFTGHASSINILRWANTAGTSHRFFSAAERDRYIYVWDTEGASVNEKPIASISLDSDVRSLGLNVSDPTRQTLVALSTSGNLSFIPIPVDFPASHSTPDKPDKIHSLLPRSTIISVSKSRNTDPPVIDLVSIPGHTGSIRVVRLVRNIRPVFDTIRYLDENGNYIQNLALEEVDQNAPDDSPQLAPNKRYAEASSITVGSGFDIDQREDNEDSIAQRDIDGSLQVDLAELSLGQRLTAVSTGDLNLSSESEEREGPIQGSRQAKSTKKQAQTELSVIPANSLTRTVIQALHSSDSRLLEMCLAHSDPVLIRNTVRRLPPQLAIPLINACVERLGRGARVANMKGGGGGASSQRGSGLVTWVNTVLAVHTGHLMTIPDLVARLSGLHAALTARLSLHESLLSLSGRLDTVLSQVEFRASTAPASLVPLGEKAAKMKQHTVVKRYVEGESDSDEEEENMHVEIEAGNDDDGSIEDIELGGESESEDDDDDRDESGEGNGFIDDEAEEDFSDEDEDESE